MSIDGSESGTLTSHRCRAGPSRSWAQQRGASPRAIVSCVLSSTLARSSSGRFEVVDRGLWVRSMVSIDLRSQVYIELILAHIV